MKIKYLRIIFISSLFLSSSSGASLLESLSQCNGVFFTAVDQSNVIPKNMKRVFSPGQAIIVTDKKSDLVSFSPVIYDNELTITHYFNKNFSQTDFGEVLLWGFIVREPLAEVLT